MFSRDHASDVAAVALSGLAAVFGLWALQVGWSNGLLDLHAWRQTHTAISAHAMVEGGPFWRYQTPIFGPPWRWPLEFPVYQGLVATATSVFGTALEQTGRAVSVLFFLGTLAALWSALDIFAIRPLHRTVVIALVLASPLYIFWSRTFMIESTALCFSVTYLAAVHAASWRPQAGLPVSALVLAAASGALAGATKVTTLVPYFVAAVVLILIRARNGQWSRSRIAWVTAAAVALPIVLTSAWLLYVDSVKLANPITADLSWADEGGQRFGTFAERLDWKSWYAVPANHLYGGTPHAVVPNVLVFGLALLALTFHARRRMLCLGCLLLYFLPMAVFLSLYLNHVYYSYATGLFLLVILGSGIVTCLESARWRWAGVGLLAAAFAVMGNNYLRGYYNVQTAHQVPWDMAAQTMAHTAPRDVVLIYGQRYSPVLPYESRRRAIMDWQSRSVADPAIRAEIDAVEAEGARIGAIVACAEARQDPTVRANVTSLGFNEAPRYAGPGCDLYVLP